MIELDTQIIPTARAMSFLFSGCVQLSKCAKNFTLSHHGAVDALVALDDVLGEEAAASQLGYAQRDVAHARRQVALAVAVAAVGAARAQLIGLGVHYRVDHVLGQAPYEPLRFIDPSSNLGIAACPGMLSARLSIAALVLSFEPVMSAIPDSKASAASHQSHSSSLCLHQH